MEVLYPEVEVRLTGNSGNAFAILGAVQKGLRQGPGKEAAAAFMAEAMAGDYDHLLQTAMKYVTVN